MRKSLAGSLILLMVWPLFSAPQRKKKSEEEITQTREIYEDPPSAIVAPTGKLVFQVAPLSAKGLLSQQVRDALRALLRAARGGTIVKLRGFVAGTGDLRRVQSIVSEEFTEKRLPLPALTTVQVGALPMEGAQIMLEAMTVAKKTVNPHGLAFLSGQAVESEKPEPRVAPLIGKAVAQLREILRAGRMEPSDVVRTTCFVSSLEDYPQVHGAVAGAFPRAAIAVVQLQRIHLRGLVECEAVARLKSPLSSPVEFLNVESLPRTPNYSHAALVSAPRLALSGLRMAFQFEPSDARLAFQRLDKELQQVNASPKTVVMSNIYPLTRPVLEIASKVRFEFYDRKQPPASTMLLFEGLPSLDASFGVEVVAIAPE